jgi:hypothetical protein|tara:strand:+ start:472 stop:1587 length:1116 start_codon:yes stop_codon:yes gene_type:complete
MYRINKSSNNITKLEKRQFKDLGFREREHLQEWIAKNPDVLGEELLIIQKEYNGFNDTNERLDLLALDKDGGLVIIENKLDDTGTDVVWQALKYTSYCSTLTTEQIIRLYQEYLNSYSNAEDAKELLLDFLEREDDEDLLLNSNDQRIVFIANNYRKEVTSTALWLLDHDIQLQCFRASPYSLGEDLFLQIEQIIPLPETNEYMIDAKEKQKEKKVKSKKVEETNSQLLEFWIALKKALQEENINYLDRVKPNSYFSIGFWKGQGRFSFCLGRKSFRVELYFNNDADKSRFDAMYGYKDEIEESLNGVEWQRLDDKKASRIRLDTTPEQMESFEGKWEDKTSWDDVITWYIQNMRTFYDTINPVWQRVQNE